MCFYFSENNFEIVRALRENMLRTVAPALIPTLILPTNQLSRTDTGKISRKEANKQFVDFFSRNLKESVRESTHIESRQYSETSVVISDALAKILNILRNILPMIAFSEYDVTKKTFFEIGGDSMLGIEFIWKLKSELDIILQVRDLRETFEELAARIVSCNAETNPSKRIKTERSQIVPGSISSSTFSSHRYANFPFSSVRHIESPICCKIQNDNPEMKIIWQTKLEKCVDAAPLIVVLHTDDSGDIELVFIGSHGGDFICCRADNGSIIWKAKLGINHHIEASSAIALIDSVPVVVVVSFIGSDIDGARLEEPAQAVDESNGAVWCLHALTGELVWHRLVDGEVFRITPYD